MTMATNLASMLASANANWLVLEEFGVDLQS